MQELPKEREKGTISECVKTSLQSEFNPNPHGCDDPQEVET